MACRSLDVNPSELLEIDQLNFGCGEISAGLPLGRCESSVSHRKTFNLTG